VAIQAVNVLAVAVPTRSIWCQNVSSASMTRLALVKYFLIFVDAFG
jgi:hypothetical protein